MKMTNNGYIKGKALLAVFLMVLILFPLGYTVVSHVLPQNIESPDVFLEPADTKQNQCVKDTAYMRFHHWELLRGIREEVVRYGLRGEIGLKQCRDCHRSRERFCNRCHDAVSLSPDCFECHYYP
jgi:hypothetical protein